MANKKITIIIAGAVIALIIAVGAGVYFAVKKTQQEIPALSEAIPASEIKPSVKLAVKPRLTNISDQPAIFFWTIGDVITSISGQPATSTQIVLEKQILYFNQKGQILKIKEKDDEIISDRQIDDIQAVKSSKDGGMIIVKYGILSSPQFEIFNVATKVWQSLNSITAADFSPDGSQIVYLENAKNSTASNLIIKNLSGKQKISTVLAINQKDFDLKWLTVDKILLISRPSADYQNEIWTANVKTKTINLLSRDTGLIINWAKDASFGLKFFSNQKGEGKLKLIDKEGITKADLNFSVMPEKCIVMINKIYCAAPYDRTTIKDPFLPDDYLKKAVYFSDFIYEINIDGNSLKTIFNETEPVLDAFNLSLFDNKILFINKYDNKVYSLNL